MFQGVLEKVEQRLAGWKSKCLSLAGRITLIKSTLTAIPAYIMQSTRLPRSLCDDLDKRVRRFLWGGTELIRKPHLVAWDIVTKEKTCGGLGIRSMRQLNSAFLMKLGWRLHSEPSALWVRLIKEKYMRGNDLFHRMGQHHFRTNAWRGIMETMESTEKGLGMALGDGRNTAFWEHRWLDGRRLVDHAIAPIPAPIYYSRVRDFWEPLTGWDWTRLSPYLPQVILDRMSSFDLGDEVIEDTPLWTASNTGSFTIASAIKILRGLDTLTGVQWNWVWKIRLPYRIQVFLWLLSHRRLLTNAERHRRKFSPDPLCGVCFEEAEDLDHLFRRCPTAQAVWQALHSCGLNSTATEATFHDWFQANFHGNHVDPQWPRKFAIILWFLWKWRCSTCLGSMEFIPFDKGTFLTHQIQRILDSLDSQTPAAAGRGCSERWIHWDGPEPGWHVLNTDGASQGTVGRAGAGGVVRGERGEWIIGFSEPLGRCPALQAELRAVLRGLRIAKEMGTRKLWVQVDSRVVVTLLTTMGFRRSEYHGLIHQCRTLLAWECWETRITHCFREANQVADRLANIGVQGSPGVTMYSRPPREVHEALFSDRMGALWPRQLHS